ncbi:hypothetical protein Nans01_45720 [Nocardiopsis ansamitocini]|uniref:Uncharacterized protein n=1 Tax=Nocardiopsis ansamitocini TaxID=1670832 RepID=A0A9W6UIS4_9ACTN|nr:hypothetical protein Nans01_45720 [Nocardiopsis ansamitocini]
MVVEAEVGYRPSRFQGSRASSLCGEDARDGERYCSSPGQAVVAGPPKHAGAGWVVNGRLPRQRAS